MMMCAAGMPHIILYETGAMNMNKTRKNEPGKPWSQRLCETLDIPVGTFGRISFIEAVGNRELCVSGCEGLMSYTGERVELELCDGTLTVYGSALELRSYTGGRVSVSGVITGIRYGQADGDGDAC